MCSIVTFLELDCHYRIRKHQNDVIVSNFVIEHSILPIEYASYNKGGKDTGSAFDLPTQVATTEHIAECIGTRLPT